MPFWDLVLDLLPRKHRGRSDREIFKPNTLLFAGLRILVDLPSSFRSAFTRNHRGKPFPWFDPEALTNTELFLSNRPYGLFLLTRHRDRMWEWNALGRYMLYSRIYDQCLVLLSLSKNWY